MRTPDYTDLTRLVWSKRELQLIIREVRLAGAVKTLKRLRAARSSLYGAIRHAENWESRKGRAYDRAHKNRLKNPSPKL